MADTKDLRASDQQVEQRPASPMANDDMPDKHSTMDAELRQYVMAGEGVVIDEATNKRLRRMIDKRVLIVMVGTYFLQSMDKNAISFAVIMGIKEDAHLVGQDVREFYSRVQGSGIVDSSAY